MSHNAELLVAVRLDPFTRDLFARYCAAHEVSNSEALRRAIDLMLDPQRQDQETTYWAGWHAGLRDAKHQLLASLTQVQLALAAFRDAAIIGIRDSLPPDAIERFDALARRIG